MHYTLLLLASLLLLSFKSDKPAYRLFDKKGKEVSYQTMLKSLEQSDVVLFGEIHNNPIAHWLELEVTKDLSKSRGGQLELGAEMFEADDQIVLNEYLKGLITGQQFQNETKVWRNFETDYKPLLEYAKQHQILFVATNIPRRYASLVAKSGLSALDQLPAEAKAWIAPLPIQVDLSLPGYKSMLEMMGSHGEAASQENFARAQAIKDATMAHFILSNYTAGQTFLHFNGTYHSQNFEGIVWYLKKQNPNLKITTIHSVEQENVNRLEKSELGVADFVLAIPADMTKTH